MVRAHAASLEPLEITLGLICGANMGVITRLAGLLPLTALGFQTGGVFRAITAAQFRIQPASALSSFNGTLTEHFPASKVLDLIEELLASPAGAIRSTAFNLNVRKLQWKGAPPGSSGSIDLFDLKHFGRVKRFSLTACLELPGNNPKSPDVRESIKQVAHTTGLAFDKSKLHQTPAQDTPSPAHAKSVLVGQICFNEAVEDLTSQLSGRWVSEFAPNALPLMDAARARLQLWGTGASEKVNLAPIVKRITKELVPELKFSAAGGDDILFKKELAPDSEIIAIFSKTMPKIGKALELSLGLQSLDGLMRFTVGVFQLDRTTERRNWIYSTGIEAEAMVREAANLLKELLPRFEAALLKYFKSWPREFPDGIERHGNLTAREAFEKAQMLVRNRFPDAVLIRLDNQSQSLVTRDVEGPELSTDGRLTPNALWSFHFYSELHDTSFQVAVPAVGRIRMSDHGNQYKDPNGRRYLMPVGHEWLDSDRVFALAEERGGRERRESGRPFGICTRLEMSRSGQPRWEVRYLIVDDRGRNDLTVHMDAISGEEIEDTRGC
jgi:hypothetical protein